MNARFLGKALFASLFLASGVGHFLATDAYLRIMPPYLPYPRELVWISGACEIAGGLGLLIPRTSRWAAWGLIALLIAVFPANLYMYQHAGQFRISALLLAARLPLQALLIWWAWAYANKPVSSRGGGIGSRGEA